MRDAKRLRIYVAGPYTNGDQRSVLENVRRAIDMGIQIWKKGHYPFIPHLTHFIDEYARQNAIPMDWKEYIEWDRPWLESCDALLYLAPSKGANLELARAKEQGLKIYREIAEVPEIAEERRFPMTEQMIHVSRHRQ